MTQPGGKEPTGADEMLLGSTIESLRVGRPTPLLVALDGRSAAGKSTLAGQVATGIGAIVIDGDDFYSGGTATEWDAMSPAEKVAHCIDWKRQRPVLEALSRGEPASWNRYDWEANDGRLVEHPTTVGPSPVVILEGVYSGRPELADLHDLRVLYDAPADLRRERLIQREGEGFRDEWNARWSEAEHWYFTRVMPEKAFDLVIRAAN
jgi:uridine kinase